MNEELVQLYNYDAFVPAKFERWLNFDDSPPLGTPGPDFTLRDLDGAPVQLTEVWAAAPFTVVEFGSFT